MKRLISGEEILLNYINFDMGISGGLNITFLLPKKLITIG